MESQIDSLRMELSQGKPQHELIASMKHRGFTIIDAIKASRSLFSLSLKDANDLVATHPDYVEIAVASIPLQDAFFDALEELSARQDD